MGWQSKNNFELPTCEGYCSANTMLFKIKSSKLGERDLAARNPGWSASLAADCTPPHADAHTSGYFTAVKVTPRPEPGACTWGSRRLFASTHPGRSPR